MQSKTVERTYQVVQFEPLKVSQTITIDADLEPEAQSLLDYFLILEVELTASKYMLLAEKLNKMQPAAEVAFLEAELAKVSAKLQTTYEINLGAEE